jgi:hypothetical protein
MSTVSFLCSLYLQQVRGYSPLTTGLIFGARLGFAADACAVLAVALLVVVFLRTRPVR